MVHSYNAYLFNSTLSFLMPNNSVKKLHIVTHGCQMNEYDSSRMADLLGDSHNMVATENADEADVLLLNTCSIREKAQ